jgi:deazaflavin-dependent oxidoreductase (nitroreductase family)
MLVDLLGRAALAAGRAALVGGLGLLALALVTELLPLLVTAAAVAGVGQGITFRAGLTQLNEQAPEGRRAEVASAFFTVMYAGISVPVLGVGLGADAWGLRPAGIAFCLTMAASCLIPLLLGRRTQETVVARNSDLPMARTTGRVMPAWAARWNKALNNRLFSRIAPFIPPYALVIHQGRRSGDEYRTPVLGFRAGDTILVALPYGERSDWVLNLMAAGQGVVLHAGKRFSITQILVVDRRSTTVATLPRVLRLAARTPKVLVARINSQAPQTSVTSRG